MVRCDLKIRSILITFSADRRSVLISNSSLLCLWPRIMANPTGVRLLAISIIDKWRKQLPFNRPKCAILNIGTSLWTLKPWAKLFWSKWLSTFRPLWPPSHLPTFSHAPYRGPNYLYSSNICAYSSALAHNIILIHNNIYSKTVLDWDFRSWTG